MSVFILCVIMLYMLSFFFKREYLYLFNITAAFALGIIAFHIKPILGLDLYRHYEFLDLIREQGWIAVKNNPLHAYQPLYGIYFYLISYLPYNGFLPGITVFIIYLTQFSVIHMIGIKNDLSKKWMVNLSFFFILCFDFLSALSGW